MAVNVVFFYTQGIFSCVTFRDLQLTKEPEHSSELLLDFAGRFSRALRYQKVHILLDSFCLHCLNDTQRSSGVHGQITCPECRRQFQIPGSGTPSELPTNFRINSLLDVLTIKECSAANVKCGNCDKRSAQTLYCFQCCSFWCEECILGHKIIRADKDHKTLALKDFQDQGIEAVLQLPAICQKKLHEKEELIQGYPTQSPLTNCTSFLMWLAFLIYTIRRRRFTTREIFFGHGFLFSCMNASVALTEESGRTSYKSPQL